LPITFRINCNSHNYQNLIAKISSEGFLPHFLTEEERQNISLRRIEWFPDSLTWELACTKKEMKKNLGVKALHKFIQEATLSGLITRQELVSMLPPLILDI
jgi:16S rRNA C967 or C1407 C5-methylase (RsmB/RsmF family)